ncbi:ATP-binding protein [Mongoliibacter ruber]|uniref:histidine kinase n=1 Tax=Mongoliibacter ruber TaxID=1750599 RepID=A0A2T0WD58_9BACT|nr:ATP-binding protein [Mongoliibacter ruber]PRY84643.1 PAS domain S-box-containing protein [Mongoliibacter ruber]
MDYNELFHQAPCGYLSLDKKGVITKANLTLCNWLGYSPIELQGLFTFQDLLSVGGKIYFETHFLPLLQLEGQASEINFEIIAKNRDKLPVLVNGTKVTFDNKIIGFRLTIVDISQRKQYEKELLKAKKLAEENALKLSEKNIELERFSNVVSHDLKSPIRTLSGLLEIMEKKGFLNMEEESIKIQKIIKDNLKRISVLVDDLMEQTLSEKETEYNEIVDLNEVVETVKEMLGDEIQKSSTQINIEVLPYVRGNKNQVIRLIQNLIMNAIKYRSEADPRIQIFCNVTDNMATVELRDNGIGFDPIFKDRIFEYMKRLHSPDKIPGSGIGLYSCKKIVESHGGKIQAESEPGQGATFVFTLPIGSSQI